MMSRTTRLFSLIAIGAILWGGAGVLHAAPAPTASLPELQNIQRKLTGLRCKDSDSRWSQKRILQLIPTILNGEDIDYSGPDMKGNTCLHYACELGSRQLIHWLVENGADVNRVETGGGNTPLHNAARLASLHTVTYLLEHGANPNVRNNEGKLPADVVGKDDHDAIVAKLTVGKETKKSTDEPLSDEKLNTLREKATMGDAEAQNRMGVIYLRGDGIKPDVKAAARWFQLAANQGNANGQYHLANLCVEGEGVPCDKKQAYTLYKKAAEQGLSCSQVCLGRCYIYGVGVSKDKETGFAWVKKAADSGNADAQCELGKCYEKGNGVSQDKKLALEFYERSATQGYVPAMYQLGQYYYNRSIYDIQTKQEQLEQQRLSIEWYKKAANQGLARAQSELGKLYMTGKMVDRDLNESVRWYKKGSEQGDRLSQRVLGICYLRGIGGTKNLDKAVELLKKSTEQGDSIAACQLGDLYYDGQGVPQDKEKAVDLYQKSANGGHWAAKRIISLMETKMPSYEGSPEGKSAWDELIDLQHNLEAWPSKNKSSQDLCSEVLSILSKIRKGECNANDSTCLHNGCKLGCMQLVRWAVANGASVNGDIGSESPLHTAARASNLAAVDFLLQQGASPLIPNSEAMTPIEVVGQENHDAICRKLRQAEAELCQPATKSLGRLKEIASQIPNVKYHDSDKSAAQQRLIKLLPLIVSGQNIDVKKESWDTCLLYACLLNYTNLANWLIDNNADVNYLAWWHGDHNTPLHYAAMNSNLELIRKLIDHGANVSYVNEKGLQPEDVIGNSRRDEAQQIFLDYYKRPFNVKYGKIQLNSSFDLHEVPDVVYADDSIYITCTHIWEGERDYTTFYNIHNAHTLIQENAYCLRQTIIENFVPSPDGKYIAGIAQWADMHCYDSAVPAVIVINTSTYETEIIKHLPYSINPVQTPGIHWKGDHIVFYCPEANDELKKAIAKYRFKKSSFSNVKLEYKVARSDYEGIPQATWLEKLGIDYMPYCASYSTYDAPSDSSVFVSETARTMNGFSMVSVPCNLHEINLSNLTSFSFAIQNRRAYGVTAAEDGSTILLHGNQEGKIPSRYYMKSGSPHGEGTAYSIIFNGSCLLTQPIGDMIMDCKRGYFYSYSGGNASDKDNTPLTLKYYNALTPETRKQIVFPFSQSLIADHPIFDFRRQLAIVCDEKYYYDYGTNEKYNSDVEEGDNFEKAAIKWQSPGVFNEQYGKPDEICRDSGGSTTALNFSEPHQNDDWSGWIPSGTMGTIDGSIADAPDGWKVFSSAQHRGGIYWGIISPENKGWMWITDCDPDSVFVAWPQSDSRVIVLGAGRAKATLDEFDYVKGTRRIIKRWDTSEHTSFYWDEKRGWLSIPIANGMDVVQISTNGDYEDIMRVKFFENGNKYAILLPDGRYSGSPGVEKYLQYTANGKTAPMSIMEPWLKKPADIIRLFGGDEEQAAALEATRNRWLKKQNITPDAPMPDLSAMPTVTVPKYPKLNAKADDIEVPIRVQAAKSAVTHVEVKVNEVAATGAEADLGTPIPAGSSRNLTAKVKLTDGLNWITVQAVTESGVKGNIERFRVIKRQPSPSRLYVVALGVSDYDAEEVPDLRFAAKDAGDVAAAVGKLEADSKVLLLRDKEVRSQDALKQIREFLSTATLNDRVIVYCAGHGVLDDGEYYYAPADYNPESTKETGISLDELKATLADTPARRRLLLLDTCNAGAIGEEAEEKLALNADNLPMGVRAIQHRGMKVKSSAMPLNSTQKRRYIEELFVTEDASTGVNVIGGSAAAEYAMESEEWNNGVFTASLLEALSPEKKLSTLPEISDYIRQRVRELTNGAQSPSVRLLESGEGFNLSPKR